MVFVLALSMVAVLSGCNSHVRTVHLVPGDQPADVYLGNKLVVNNMCYKNVSCYNEACEGCRSVKFKPVYQDRPSMVDCTVKLKADSYMTLVAMGTSPNNVEAVLYCDDTCVDSFSARIRIIHASPDAPAMNVTLVPVRRDAGSTDTQPAEPQLSEFRELCFRDASIYNEFEPGDYTLVSRDLNSDKTILKIPTMTFCKGTNYTVFIIGQTSDNSLAAMAVIDAQEPQD
jgi:hypothetical protein